MPNETDSVKIARIEQRVMGIEVTLTTHLREDAERFDKMFKFFGDRMDRMEDKLDTRFDQFETAQESLTREKITPLWDDKSSRDGALGLSKYVAGLLGGAIALLGQFFLNQHGGSK